MVSAYFQNSTKSDEVAMLLVICQRIYSVIVGSIGSSIKYWYSTNSLLPSNMVFIFFQRDLDISVKILFEGELSSMDSVFNYRMRWSRLQLKDSRRRYWGRVVNAPVVSDLNVCVHVLKNCISLVHTTCVTTAWFRFVSVAFQTISSVESLFPIIGLFRISAIHPRRNLQCIELAFTSLSSVVCRPMGLFHNHPFPYPERSSFRSIANAHHFLPLFHMHYCWLRFSQMWQIDWFLPLRISVFRRQTITYPAPQTLVAMCWTQLVSTHRCELDGTTSFWRDW